MSDFTGFALLTMTTNGMISVDACPVHIRTINAAVRNLRATGDQKKKTAAVAIPLNGLLSSSPSA